MTGLTKYALYGAAVVALVPKKHHNFHPLPIILKRRVLPASQKLIAEPPERRRAHPALHNVMKQALFIDSSLLTPPSSPEVRVLPLIPPIVTEAQDSDTIRAPPPPLTPPTSPTKPQSSNTLVDLGLGLGLVATPVSHVDCRDPIKRPATNTPPIDWEAFQFPAVPSESAVATHSKSEVTDPPAVEAASPKFKVKRKARGPLPTERTLNTEKSPLPSKVIDQLAVEAASPKFKLKRKARNPLPAERTLHTEESPSPLKTTDQSAVEAAAPKFKLKRKGRNPLPAKRTLNTEEPILPSKVTGQQAAEAAPLKPEKIGDPKGKFRRSRLPTDWMPLEDTNERRDPIPAKWRLDAAALEDKKERRDPIPAEWRLDAAALEDKKERRDPIPAEWRLDGAASQVPDDNAIELPVSPSVEVVKEVATEESLSMELLPTKVSFIIPETPETGFAIPLYRSGSPLRPSQWAARGGSRSPLRSPNRHSDRFIPQRRPEISTRESFHLSRATPVGTTNPDPFSPVLRRSRRVNEELRTLRQNHSMMTARNRSRGRIGLRSTSTGVNRQVSAGAVWNVGGSSAATDTVVGVTNGRGGLLASGTNAALYTTMFITGTDAAAELDTYEQRLALALDIDQSDKTLHFGMPPLGPPLPQAVPNGESSRTRSHVRPIWNDSTWMRRGSTTQPSPSAHANKRSLPMQPYRVLEAPDLRDDYYCSVLSYHPPTKILAVGLGNVVHLWTEKSGVGVPDTLNAAIHESDPTGYITSLALLPASPYAVIAVGRADGCFSLWSPFDQIVRHNVRQAKPISCLSWRPNAVKMPDSRRIGQIADTYQLLVGDEKGDIFIYSIEWPDWARVVVTEWIGSIKLLAHIEVHKQQICGLAWSADGKYFATGGNDNACYLFRTRNILREVRRNQDGTYHNDPREVIHALPDDTTHQVQRSGRGAALELGEGHHEHRWQFDAAVKAIAFCPWLSCLLAVGGGSNDRTIRFFHTKTGSALAEIDCAAQVTSLNWSTTRREIAATFGFAQPEHPYRITVFSWPSCEQVVSIPWEDESRALCAIAYAGGPSHEYTRHRDESSRSRTKQEGTLIIAGSDRTIRFHEIWAERRKGKKGKKPMGLLGGSEILEDMAGIEKDWGEHIR